jgi:nucleotidyltransferase substrate binding protein (TIGR01987 family)
MSNIRWKQRYDNYLKAFQSISSAVNLAESRELSDLEKQGLIQSFEFTHELAWNVLKDYLEYQGISGLIGSRDASRTAFSNGLIKDGNAWMNMIRDRNRTSHTYDLSTANEVVVNILELFFPAFENMTLTFGKLYEQGDEQV